MAPVKRSKSVNKGFADTSSTKDEKSRQKKRKLSDMLGSQWSKHELERFYEAYRKYGHDWKKVASFVRSRSIEMVEALYNMNRAYLSLPEGTASVVGLIAMMTDHYNVRGGNGTDRGSEDPTVLARKPQKYHKAKIRGDHPEDTCQRRSDSSSHRCQSLLKMHLDGVQPCFPVRKRTPRVPVSVLDAHSGKKLRGSVMNLSNDEVSREASFLTERHQVPEPLHVPQTTYGDNERIKPSHSAMGRGPIYRGNAPNEACGDGSLGGNETKNGDLIRVSLDTGKYASSEFKKRKKIGKVGKKENVVLTEVKVTNGIGESYNFADRGQRRVLDSEGASPKNQRSSSDFQGKKDTKLMVEDERAACDALQTLAELSLMMPYLTGDPVQNGGESVGQDTVVNKDAHTDVKMKDEGNQECKMKCSSETLETLADEEVKSPDSSSHLSTVSRGCIPSIRSPDVSSCSNRSIGQVETTVSSAQTHSGCQVVHTRGRKNTRKRDRTLIQKDSNYTMNTFSIDCTSSVQDEAQSLKGKILHCLSWYDVRKWCMYEWFYSAIDYPWFAKRDFVEYLDHVGLGHIPRLTRIEWSVIRSSLGKPRRFSKRFLQEERDKLKQYRESVRTHYANLRAGLGEGLPTDLARPLSVGQKVVVIHPKTREIHNGSISTVDHHNYWVQFDNPDLGVELVMDIDCMPLNPEENMPESLRKQKIFNSQYSQELNVNRSLSVSEEHTKNVMFHSSASPSNPLIANETKVRPAFNSLPTVTGSGCLMRPSTPQSQCYMTHMQPRKNDTRSIFGSTRCMDRKVRGQNVRRLGNSSCWPQLVGNSVGLNRTIHSSNNSTVSCQETTSNVTDIVEGSRNKARRMVNTAFKAISEMKDGEDAFRRIGKALDDPDEVECATRVSMVTPLNMTQGLAHQDPVVPSISGAQLIGDASGMQSVDSAGSELQAPSNLITSCVAALLMIQTCTERQYPPDEVVQVLDKAVTNLHPRCSQNLSIYREIQMCVGIIKHQLFAMVPT